MSWVWASSRRPVVADGLSQLSCVGFAGFAVPMLVVLGQRPMCHIRVEHWFSHVNIAIAAEVLCQLNDGVPMIEHILRLLTVLRTCSFIPFLVSRYATENTDEYESSPEIKGRKPFLRHHDVSLAIFSSCVLDHAMLGVVRKLAVLVSSTCQPRCVSHSDTDRRYAVIEYINLCSSIWRRVHRPAQALSIARLTSSIPRTCRNSANHGTSDLSTHRVDDSLNFPYFCVFQDTT